MKRLCSSLLLLMVFAIGPSRANTGFSLFLAEQAASIEEVFLHGIGADGHNFDPIAHITGATCFDELPATRRSAYITLTRSEASALSAGRAVREWSEFQVFRVHPDLHAPDDLATYDVLSGISLLLNDRTLRLRQRSVLRELLASRIVDDLYMANGIPGTSIHSADHYRRNPATGEIQFIRTQLNPYYARPRWLSARQAFTDEMIRAIPEEDAHRHAVAVRGPDGTTLSVCLLSGTAQCRYDPARNVGGGQTCVSEPLTRPGDLWNTAIQTLLLD